MNELIRQALKEALTKSVEEVIAGIDAGEFDIAYIDCSCGNNKHRVTAKFCGNCGNKLDEAAATTSPM